MDVCLAMKELGVLAKPTHGHIIRFALPLSSPRKQLRDAISLYKKGHPAVRLIRRHNLT
jgi:ornithine--oxo-acid transaminase